MSILVVGLERNYPRETIDRIQRQLEEQLPNGVKVVVIPGCTALEVIPPEPLEVRL